MKLNITATDLIQKSLTKVQLRCRERNVTIDDMTNGINLIEDRLNEMHLAKKYWAGLKFRVNMNAQTFPNSYKKLGNPTATTFVVERTASGWFITRIERDYCGNKKITLVGGFNEVQKAEILKGAIIF